MSLKKIDFTSGIRSENIQYNFEYLQNDINHNRLFTVGCGIADGLEISIDKDLFEINVTDGYIIDKTGAMIAISGTQYRCDLQNDILQTVYRDHIVVDGKITLVDIPYAYNGRHVLLPSDSENSGWQDDIVFTSILGTNIVPSGFIPNNVFLFNGVDNNTVVNVKYYAPRNMIYTVYINTNNEVQICKGIASTSPSEYELSDFLYKLGNVFIHTNINGYTVMEYVADMTDRISIYTSENNELYIGGKQFSSMRHIYSTRPENPDIHDIWYNSEAGQNRLFVYTKIDDEEQWVPIGDYCFSASFTKKFWNPQEDSYNDLVIDNKYWLFSPSEQEMYFEPNSNALTVIMDNVPLHMDQFSELKLSDFVAILKNEPDSHVSSVARSLGYTDDFIDSLLYEIDLDGNIIKNKPDVCIGFYTHRPVLLDFSQTEPGPYIEAITSHLYNVPAQTYKIQKTTSFISEDHYVFDNSVYVDQKFTTKHSYKANEHQLDVFVNGVRLVCGIDYVERENENIKNVNSFKILKRLINGDIISYRINAVCYSYDNDFCENIPKGYYNFVVKRTDNESNRILLPNEYGVDTVDYLTVYTVSNRNILIRKDHNISDDISADYQIVVEESDTYIEILNESIVPLNESLYITGLKFSRYPESE